jgi:hypothetical protein
VIGRVEPPGFHLISAGAPPLRLLRYHVPPGARATLVKPLDLELSDRRATAPAPAHPEAFDLGAEVDFDVPSVEPGRIWMRAQMLKGPLAAMSVEWAMSPLGEIEQVTVLAADDDQLAAELREQIASYQPILPAEPVGVGATWEVTRVLRLGGIERTRVARWQLSAMQGDDLDLGLELTDSAEPQTYHPSGSGERHLTRLAAAETWQLRVRLDEPWPQSSDGKGSELIVSTGTPDLIQERTFTGGSRRLP